MSFYPSHPVPDADYLLRRAEAEARLAGEARAGAAEAAHHALASAYLDRLFGRCAAGDSEMERGRMDRPCCSRSGAR